MTDYITLEEFKYTREMIGFSFEDYDAQQAITAASRGIDEYTGRTFATATGTATTRYYTPLYGDHLDINDLTTVSTLTTDWDGDGTFETTWTANTDYILEPLNAAADNKPYDRIRVHSRSAYRLPAYPRSVAVTGLYGWPELPAQVKQVTTLMAARLLKRAREAPFGIAAVGLDGAPIRVLRIDPEFEWMLDPFKKGDGVLAA